MQLIFKLHVIITGLKINMQGRSYLSQVLCVEFGRFLTALMRCVSDGWLRGCAAVANLRVDNAAAGEWAVVHGCATHAIPALQLQ